MTRVDFYPLSRDPVERVVAMLARKASELGERLLVVSADVEHRKILSREMWRSGAEEFLANGDVTQPGPDRQPILLSDSADALNAAKIVIMADGKWRDEALQFERALLLFGPDDTEAARTLWRELDGNDQVQREIHKQDERGKWRAGA